MTNKNLFQSLLDYYGISEETYKELIRDVDLSNFFTNHFFDSGEMTVKFVKERMANNDKIIIYGDYDADGIMSTSIIVKLMKMHNYKADYYIPNRYLDGYGINMNKAKEIVDKGYNLLICVDNGISAFEPIEYLRNHQVNVIVIDHHEVQNNTLPLANYIMHPTVSNFGETPSSAGFTSLFFSYYFLGYMDKYLATLAAISVISDMMPLKSYNRDLLRAVTKGYKRGEFLPIDLLLGTNEFDATSIGMSISPKINALGRMVEDDSINEIVKFFTGDDKEEILNYSTKLESINSMRKELTLEAYKNINITDQKFVVEVLDNVKEGLIGLVANNITSKHNIPSIILTSGEDDIYKASGRAPEGFNLFEAVDSAGDLLLAHGGHALAGGFSIKKDNFVLFKDKFKEYFDNHPYEKPVKKDITITLNDVNYDAYNLVNSFGPFGENWKAPRLRINNIKVGALSYSKNGNAVRTPIGYNALIIGFNMPPQTFLGKTTVNFIGTLRKNVFNGRISIEFKIDEIVDN